MVSVRALMLAAIALSAVACGSAGVASTPPAMVPSVAMTPDAATPDAATPARSPMPLPPPPASDVTTYALTALAPGGPSGTVSATPGPMAVRLRVLMRGLAPRSVHTVHDHLGSCSSAPASRHLSLLATATADAAGMLSFDVAVPMFQAGAGRIVIVYGDARPDVITGCAQL